jgi:hypothetical protein
MDRLLQTYESDIKSSHSFIHVLGRLMDQPSQEPSFDSITDSKTFIAEDVRILMLMYLQVSRRRASFK